MATSDISNYNLHEFQEQPVAKAVARLNVSTGFALFCEPGAGKTIMALDILNKIATHDQELLIVCKNTIQQQWLDNLAKFLVRDLVIQVTTYDLLHKEVAKNYDIIIVDESHKFKGLGTNRQKNLFKLMRPHQKRLILTGTPMDGKLEELWPQIHFIDSKILGDYQKSFKRKYCKVDYFQSIIGYKNLDKFQDAISKVSAKTKPLPLPKTRTIYMAMPVDDTARDKVSEVKRTLEWKPVGADIPMPIYAQPQLDSAEHQLITRGCHSDGIRLIRNLGLKHKLIVIYWYKEDLRMLQIYLYGLNVYEFRVGKQQKDEFIQHDGPAVLIAQQGVLGEGVDGLQAVCNLMVLYSYSYSWTTWYQVKKRIHRIGQDKPVTFIHMYHKGYVTERITKRLKRKESFVSKTLEFKKE